MGKSTALICGLALVVFGHGPGAVAQITSPAADAPGANGQDEAGMADFYKGALKISLPAFKTYHVTREFLPDHSFTDREGGKVSAGTWSLENGKICTQHPKAQRYCNTGLGHIIGDSWQDKDPYTGNEVDFALVAGRKAAH